jgi:hypothetical protein
MQRGGATPVPRPIGAFYNRAPAACRMPPPARCFAMSSPLLPVEPPPAGVGGRRLWTRARWFVLVAVFAVLAVLVFRNVVRPLLDLARGPKDDPRRVEVIEDGLGLTKSSFARYDVGCTIVTDVATGNFHEDPGDEVLIADCNQARIYDRSGRPLGSVRFAAQMNFAHVVHAGTAEAQWIVIDEWVFPEVKAVKSSGEVIWRRALPATAPPAERERSGYGGSAGNLDDDSAPEFAVWKYRTGEMEVINDDGTVLRKVEVTDPIQYAVILEGSRPADARIAYANFSGELVMLDRTGREVSRSRPDTQAVNLFVPLEWPDLVPDKVLLQNWWQNYDILRYDGSKVTSLESPSLRSQYTFVPIRAAVARFPGRMERDLLTLTRLSAHHRTAFDVFDPSGALLYREMLDGWYGGLAVLADDQGSVESILVGGERETVRYTPRAASPAPN